MIQAISKELLRLDIDLSSDAKTYSLNQIKDAFSIIFGVEAANLLIENLRRELKK
jgi:hypothetical protein